MPMAEIELKAAPLTRATFAPFGDVIETEGAHHFPINAGAIERFHDLARVDVGEEHEGHTLISIARCNQPTSPPFRVGLVERHPLGSQAFIPLGGSPLIVVVAAAGERVEPAQLRAFISNGRQGINFHRGTWHMPMIALDQDQQMVIVDRGGPGQNCDEWPFRDQEIVVRV